jgi:hypothetical protein
MECIFLQLATAVKRIRWHLDQPHKNAHQVCVRIVAVFNATRTSSRTSSSAFIRVHLRQPSFDLRRKKIHCLIAKPALLGYCFLADRRATRLNNARRVGVHTIVDTYEYFTLTKGVPSMFVQTIRKNLAQAVAIPALLALALGTAWALQAGGGILFPDWSKPTKGTYQAPASEVGKKTKNVWSVTTVSSSIEGKTVKGKAVSVVGEIVDLSCYLQVGKHGDKHRDCGQKCVKNGQPVGLLASDGTVYLLCDEEHDPRRDGMTEFRKAAVELMAHIVTVNGTQTEVGGQKAIFVQGFLSKK